MESVSGGPRVRPGLDDLHNLKRPHLTENVERGVQGPQVERRTQDLLEPAQQHRFDIVGVNPPHEMLSSQSLNSFIDMCVMGGGFVTACAHHLAT